MSPSSFMATKLQIHDTILLFFTFLLNNKSYLSIFFFFGYLFTSYPIKIILNPHNTNSEHHKKWPNDPNSANNTPSDNHHRLRPNPAMKPQNQTHQLQHQLPMTATMATATKAKTLRSTTSKTQNATH